MATDLAQTNLPFLAEDCAVVFGKEQGARIFEKTLSLYNELAASADFLGSEAIKYHMTAKLFPAMSFYKALLSFGFSREEALQKVSAETQKAALVKKEENERFARMPFVYTFYRMGVKKHMAKNFPAEGWRTEWVKCDGHEIHFNLHTCLYYDVCMQNGCPELCTVYCKSDIVSFSGLQPKIDFERSGTIGEGAPYCDFHFIKGKKE